MTTERGLSRSIRETRIRRRARLQRILTVVLVVAGLSGCGTLPDAKGAIDSPRLYQQSPQFAGGDGPLPADRDRRIVTRLEQRTGDTDILDRHLAFEQAITGSPLIVGNKVTLLKNGPDTYRAMFDAIESASDSINLETFTFDDDTVGKKFADMLIAKEQAGVQVNIIFDNFE